MQDVIRLQSLYWVCDRPGWPFGNFAHTHAHTQKKTSQGPELLILTLYWQEMASGVNYPELAQTGQTTSCF